jgi:uncharacterized protein HemY
MLAAPGPVAVLGTAQESLASGDLDAAEAACREVLATVPEHPEALRIWSHCEYERGRTAAALRLALRAAQGLRAQRPAPAAEYRIWTDLSAMFTYAVTAAAMRERLVALGLL